MNRQAQKTGDAHAYSLLSRALAGMSCHQQEEGGITCTAPHL